MHRPNLSGSTFLVGVDRAFLKVLHRTFLHDKICVAPFARGPLPGSALIPLLRGLRQELGWLSRFQSSRLLSALSTINQEAISSSDGKLDVERRLAPRAFGPHPSATTQHEQHHQTCNPL
jgi:hypothetical protein